MERRRDLDFTKGIGIVLMVLGHCYTYGNGEAVLCWIYSFHMPLFFIIPGIVYSIGQHHKHSRFLEIFKRKVSRLLIPYFFFATATAIALCVIGRKEIADFLGYMRRIVTLQGINAMWFIPCFLAAELVFILVTRTKHPKRGSAFLALTGIAAVSFPVLKQTIPMLQTIVIGAAFLALGFLLADIYVKPVNPLIWGGCVIVHFIAALGNRYVDLAYGVYGNTGLYFLNGLLGTFVTIQAAHYFEKGKVEAIFTWLGQNTIVVLGTSSLVIEILRLFDYKLFRSSLQILAVQRESFSAY